MEHWNEARYEREKRDFIRRRANWSPLWMHFTLLFAATWGAAWVCSAALLWLFGTSHDWARLLPLRYAIAFLFAYAVFFLAARLWIAVVNQSPDAQFRASDLGDAGMAGGGGEGCLIALVLVVIGFLVGGLFLAIGGAPMLLEAAFEAAFAGVVVVRPLRGKLVIGNWKGRLLTNTWKPALGAFLPLIALAAFLQHKAPQATTFAQAVSVMLHDAQPAQPHQ